MSHKTMIGHDDSQIVEQARTEQARADQVNSEYTMMQRRIRTFHNELSYVRFDVDTAPAWAEHWLEWLLTGATPQPEVEEIQAEQESEEVLDDDGFGEIVVEDEPADDNTETA